MRSASFTGQFRRDVKLAEKRGKDMNKLREIVDPLLAGNPLPRELRDHALKGEWTANRDLRIEPDWVLIYSIEGASVRFERTGSHADLFGR